MTDKPDLDFSLLLEMEAERKVAEAEWIKRNTPVPPEPRTITQIAMGPISLEPVEVKRPAYYWPNCFFYLGFTECQNMVEKHPHLIHIFHNR